MELYRTHVLDAAAYMLSRGAVFKGLTFDQPRRALFLFENKETCEQMYADYLNDFPISARDFSHRKKELADLLAVELEKQRIEEKKQYDLKKGFYK